MYNESVLFFLHNFLTSITMTFSRAHLSMLIKYIGISFITGAISHGAFSGTRSVLTGIFGIVFFVIGTMMEKNIDHT